MTPTTGQLRPSAVSRRVLEQHRSLAPNLDELSLAGEALKAGGPGALRHALDLVRGLQGELLGHIAFEGKILVPALRDIDAWGAIRADKLIDRLRVRRREIESLLESCARLRTGILGDVINRFIDDRRADMAWVERHVVHENVLRDDVIGVDVGSG